MKSQYITNIKGKKISVILPIREYEKMMEQLEELEDIKAYDDAIKLNEDVIPANQALFEIESKRHDLRR
jgi:spore germination protein YaaH